MVTKIGIVAGDIWHYLDKKGSTGVEDIVKALPYKREVVFMSIGWLAREGHIVLVENKKGLVAFLREKKNRVSPGRKKSLALMTVLIVVFIITCLAAVILHFVGNQAIIAEHKIRRSKAIYAARAGIISAMECLRQDNCRGCSPIASKTSKGSCSYTDKINGYDVKVTIDNDSTGESKYKIDVSVNYP